MTSCMLAFAASKITRFHWMAGRCVELATCVLIVSGALRCHGNLSNSIGLYLTLLQSALACQHQTVGCPYACTRVWPVGVLGVLCDAISCAAGLFSAHVL